jgi:hypothetical protein
MSEEKSAQIATSRVVTSSKTGGGQGSDEEVDDLLLLVMNDSGGGAKTVPSGTSNQQTPFPSSQNLVDILTGDTGGRNGNVGVNTGGNLSVPVPVPGSGTSTSAGLSSGSSTTSGFRPNPSGSAASGSGSGSGSVNVNVREGSQPMNPSGNRELLRKGDFVIFGQVQSNPQNVKQYALRLLFYNTGTTRLTDFKVEYQIQPGWQLKVQPADGTVLEVRGSSPLTQVLHLFNQTNAPFNLHVRVTYLFGAQPLRETGTITSLT